jgi:hypothetical protein
MYLKISDLREFGEDLNAVNENELSSLGDILEIIGSCISSHQETISSNTRVFICPTNPIRLDDSSVDLNFEEFAILIMESGDKMSWIFLFSIS